MINSLCPWKENFEQYLVPNHSLQVSKKSGGGGLKYQVKRSVHHTSGKWHDFKAQDDMSQSVTINNKPFTADVVDMFDKPYVITALPLTDGKVPKYMELMNVIQGSAHRIHMAFLDMEISCRIVQSLVNKFNAMRVGHSTPFSWDTSLCTNSLRSVVQDYSPYNVTGRMC